MNIPAKLDKLKRFEIKCAFERLEENNPEWLAAILNRPSGSQWGRPIVSWHELANLDWDEIPDRNPWIHQDACDYFDCNISEAFPDALENIKMLAEFTNLSEIEIVKGAHGVELRSALVIPRKTRIGHLIIGEGSDKNKNLINGLMVWTAYPGKMTASLLKQPEWDGTMLALEKIAQTPIAHYIAIKGL